MYIFGAMSVQVFCSFKKLGCLIFLLSCNNVLICISNRHLQHQVQPCSWLCQPDERQVFPCISDPSLWYSQLGDFCGCCQPRSHCYCFKICICFFGCIGSQLRHVGSLILTGACGVSQLWHMGSSCPTRERTWTLHTRSVESQPLNHQWSPWTLVSCLFSNGLPSRYQEDVYVWLVSGLGALLTLAFWVLRRVSFSFFFSVFHQQF